MKRRTLFLSGILLVAANVQAKMDWPDHMEAQLEAPEPESYQILKTFSDPLLIRQAGARYICAEWTLQTSCTDRQICRVLCSTAGAVGGAAAGGALGAAAAVGAANGVCSNVCETLPECSERKVCVRYDQV